MFVKFFCRMADGDGPWYDGLIDEWDKEHRARAIEKGEVRSKTYQFLLFLICVLVLIKKSLYLQPVVAMRMRGHAADDFPYDAHVRERSNFKKFPTHTQDHGDA